MFRETIPGRLSSRERFGEPFTSEKLCIRSWEDFGKNSPEKASVENIYEENVRKILRLFVRFYPLLKVGCLTFEIIVLFALKKAL